MYSSCVLSQYTLSSSCLGLFSLILSELDSYQSTQKWHVPFVAPIETVAHYSTKLGRNTPGSQSIHNLQKQKPAVAMVCAKANYIPCPGACFIGPENRGGHQGRAHGIMRVSWSNRSQRLMHQSPAVRTHCSRTAGWGSSENFPNQFTCASTSPVLIGAASATFELHVAVDADVACGCEKLPPIWILGLPSLAGVWKICFFGGKGCSRCTRRLSRIQNI